MKQNTMIKAFAVSLAIGWLGLPCRRLLPV